MDINQQMVFDRLPLNEEQRKKLYEALNAERQKVRYPAENSVTPDFPDQSGSVPPVDSSPTLKTH